MLVLAVEIDHKGFLLDINNLDRLIAIPDKIVADIESGNIPDEVIVSGKIKKLVASRKCNNSKIKLKIGSRIVLSKSHPDYAFLIELVWGVVNINQSQSLYAVYDDVIFKYLSLNELLELSHRC